MSLEYIDRPNSKRNALIEEKRVQICRLKRKVDWLEYDISVLEEEIAEATTKGEMKMNPECKQRIVRVLRNSCAISTGPLYHAEEAEHQLYECQFCNNADCPLFSLLSTSLVRG